MNVYKKIIFSITMLVLTGCASNIAVLSKGVGLQMTWQPDTLIPQINVGYYENSTAIIKNNAEYEYKSDGILGIGDTSRDAIGVVTPTSSANSLTNMRLHTGEQIQGYEVEKTKYEVQLKAYELALKQGITDADKYLEDSISRGVISLDDAVNIQETYKIIEDKINTNISISNPN